MTEEAIPTTVLDLLKVRWQPTQVGFSFFEAAWERDRREYPSWYIYRKDADESDPHSMKVFKYAEVKALAAVPQFVGLILDRPENYAVNEHLEHAISDFASTVYDAWDVLLKRVEAARAAQIIERE